PGRRQGWDLVGVALATAGLFGIVFGLIEGQRYNWGEIASYGITIPEVIGGGLALMILFVVWEHFQTQPLVPLSLFEERNFAVAGMGMTSAPMTTIAMRNSQPRMAGAASGVLNTTRQLGAAIGSATVGALLQNQLATALHNEAVAHAGEVPAAFRDRFIAIFSTASSNGFQIGAGQTGASLPSGLPPAVAA